MHPPTVSIELEFTAPLAPVSVGAAPQTLPARISYDHVVLPGDFPDPTVTKIGDTYWASATTAEWGAIFPIFSSKNLLDWELVGHVFPDRQPDWASSNFWAPEFHHENGRTFMYYTARSKQGGMLCVAVASADHPAGPYRDHGILVGQEAGSIDGFAMPDEHGDLYLVWKEDGNSCQQETPIWAQRLNPERTALIGEATELFTNDVKWEGPLVEGSALVRHNGWFYHFYAGNSCCGKGCNYATGVARSRTLLGPWEKHPQNPILDRNNVWKCPGHGTVTELDGRWFLLHHAYLADSHEFVGRQGLLSEFTWNAQEWPEFVNRSPQAAPLTDVTRLNVAEEFEGDQLGLEWQWPITAPKPHTAMRGGQLHLAAGSSRLGNLVARRTHVATYKAATTLDFANLPVDTYAGIAAVGDPYNALALMAGNGQVQIWHVKSGKQQCLAQLFVEPCDTLTLRLEVWGGQRYRFAYSTDGATWQPLPTESFSLNGTYLPPWDRGVRVALVAQGAEGTAAVFNNFIVRNKR
ncbi:family 43 glycosylhydrolase [Hymenobacter sp. M29]|uniref:Family 43 glycosylhydrolase n=1 Tax=Hymenobacter mellowenesis TaxID=3063995 RepID=A0ABT9AJX6_9BACT|nr:family 43 glycosylhydrolase [Hymenobacter sp. M29]MDO7849336.1 family 43 glycosylhydrolase [Hymenobacter sp. M29]